MAASETAKPRSASRKTRQKGIDRLQSLPLELWLLVSSAVSTMWCRSISCCVDAALRCRVFTFRLSVLIDTPPLLYPAQQIASHVSEPNSVDSSDQCDSLAALLALSTVSRSWRNLVLSPSCERLWLVAIEKAGLPELEAPPPKVVQYANLVVGRQCKVRFGCSSEVGAWYPLFFIWCTDARRECART